MLVYRRLHGAYFVLNSVKKALKTNFAQFSPKEQIHPNEHIKSNQALFNQIAAGAKPVAVLVQKCAVYRHAYYGWGNQFTCGHYQDMDWIGRW
jgi:hypothetical protein